MQSPHSDSCCVPCFQLPNHNYRFKLWVQTMNANIHFFLICGSSSLLLHILLHFSFWQTRIVLQILIIFQTQLVRCSRWVTVLWLHVIFFAGDRYQQLECMIGMSHSLCFLSLRLHICNYSRLNIVLWF